MSTNYRSEEEEQLINDTNEKVDEINGLDLNYADNVRQADIIFISVDRYRAWTIGKDVAGEVIETINQWYVLSKDHTPNSDE